MQHVSHQSWHQWAPKLQAVHHTMYFPVAQAAAVKLGDQNVVFELTDVIKAPPSIKYN